MDWWQTARADLVIALIWAFTHTALFLVALSGAVASYLLYAFPESARIKKVLSDLFPKVKGAASARLNFLTTTLLGTFVATIILRPDTNKEAFLAGFIWLGILRHYRHGSGRSNRDQ
jgi:hypothetical protein